VQFFHFVAEGLPRLLRVQPFVQSRPSLRIFFAGAPASSPRTPFAHALFAALGLDDRVLPFDPCGTTRARRLYNLLAEGRRLPSRQHARELHTLLVHRLMPSTLPVRDVGESSECAHAIALL
jgi:hypothetical protein